MSNYHDASLLVQDGVQGKIARAIARGVQDYIEGNATDFGAGATPPPDVALSPAPTEEAAPDAATSQPER